MFYLMVFLLVIYSMFIQNLLAMANHGPQSTQCSEAVKRATSKATDGDDAILICPQEQFLNRGPIGGAWSKLGAQNPYAKPNTKEYWKAPKLCTLKERHDKNYKFLPECEAFVHQEIQNGLSENFDAQRDQLHAKIGQQAVEIDFLVKKSKQLGL